MDQSVLSLSVLAPWVANLANGIRCLWVINRATGTITWKRRDEYSWCNEKGHLTSVFQQMEVELSRFTPADPDDLSRLCKLRSRVVKKFERYNTTHSWLYKWLFTGQLDAAYQNLLNRIDNSLYGFLTTCNEVPQLAKERDQERLFNLLIDRNTENESLFKFLDRFPQFYGRVSVPTIQANLSRIPIASFSQLSQEQVAMILLNINEPVFEEASASSSFMFSSANWFVGARRLIAIGIERLHEFGLLGQVNVGLFDDTKLVEFFGNRWDLLPQVEFNALDANLSRIPIKQICRFEDDFLQQFSLRLLDETSIRQIGLSRFSPNQLLRKNVALLLEVEKQKVWQLKITTLTPLQIAVLYDSLSNNQMLEIDLSALSKEDVATILDGKCERIKRLGDFAVAQNLDKFPELIVKCVTIPQLYSLAGKYLTSPQISAISAFLANSAAPSSTDQP